MKSEGLKAGKCFKTKARWAMEQLMDAALEDNLDYALNHMIKALAHMEDAIDTCIEEAEKDDQ